MNKGIYIPVVLMAIAMLFVGAVAATDVNSATDFENTNMSVNIDNDIDAIITPEISIETADDNTDLENDSIDDIVIEENETPVVEDINITTVPEETVVEDGNDTYSQLTKLLDPEYKGKSPKDTEKLYKIYDEILDLYIAGHTPAKICADFNMTAEQIQTLANYQYPTIVEDSDSNEIFKLYGSYTLEEISEKTGLSEFTVLEKLGAMRGGVYGVHFTKMLTKRDLVNYHDKHPEFIIK